MRRAFVTMAVSALVLATACTGTPDAPVVTGESDQPSASPSASPSGTSQSNPTDPPEEFARQYVRATNNAITTGDVRQLRALSLPACSACEQNAKAMEKFHANGGSYQGDPTWHVTDLGKPDPAKEPVIVSMYVEVKPVKIVAKKGATPKPDVGHVFLIDLTLGKEDGRWKARDVVINSG